MSFGNRNKFTSFGRGRQKKTGEMNRTETKYRDRLESMKQSGLIIWYAYEPMTFRLAKGTSYNPDFAVMLADGMIEFHEVKGGTKKTKVNGDVVSKPFIHDSKSTTKIKIAAEMFPFIFKVVWPERDHWHETQY